MGTGTEEMLTLIKRFFAIIFSKLKILLHIFPIKNNRIIFLSQRGTQYSCNPKYLFEYIYKLYGDKYEYIWCIDKKNKIPNCFKIKDIVKFKSLKYIYYTITSKYYISNVHIEPVFPGRKGQIVVNTWHAGGAYKSLNPNVFKTINKKIHSQDILLKMLKLRANKISYYITSCSKFKYYINKDLFIPMEVFLDIGLPRNDIFFTNNDLNNKIKSYYKIDKNKNIILYAPTFRGIKDNILTFDFSINIDDLLMNLKKRFINDFILLYRGHHYVNSNDIPDNIINASSYPDMQELLYASDVLITDYSSSIWDFSFTNKPCFIYAPDKDFYEKEQGFYTPIGEWPFPLATTNEQLMNNILNFNEEQYKTAVKKHHNDLGSYETGTACEQFCKIVLEK